MFNTKKIQELESKIERMEQYQQVFIEHVTEVMRSLQDSSKSKFMYEIREEEVEMMEDGKKFRKIRKILDQPHPLTRN